MFDSCDNPSLRQELIRVHAGKLIKLANNPTKYFENPNSIFSKKTENLRKLCNFILLVRDNSEEWARLVNNNGVSNEFFEYCRQNNKVAMTFALGSLANLFSTKHSDGLFKLIEISGIIPDNDEENPVRPSMKDNVVVTAKIMDLYERLGCPNIIGGGLEENQYLGKIVKPILEDYGIELHPRRDKRWRLKWSVLRSHLASIFAEEWNKDSPGPLPRMSLDNEMEVFSRYHFIDILDRLDRGLTSLAVYFYRSFSIKRATRDHMTRGTFIAIEGFTKAQWPDGLHTERILNSAVWHYVNDHSERFVDSNIFKYPLVNQEGPIPDNEDPVEFFTEVIVTKGQPGDEGLYNDDLVGNPAPPAPPDNAVPNETERGDEQHENIMDVEHTEDQAANGDDNADVEDAPEGEQNEEVTNRDDSATGGYDDDEGNVDDVQMGSEPGDHEPNNDNDPAHRPDPPNQTPSSSPSHGGGTEARESGTTNVFNIYNINLGCPPPKRMKLTHSYESTGTTADQANLNPNAINPQNPTGNNNQLAAPSNTTDGPETETEGERNDCPEPNYPSGSYTYFSIGAPGNALTINNVSNVLNSIPSNGSLTSEPEKYAIPTPANNPNTDDVNSEVTVEKKSKRSQTNFNWLLLLCFVEFLIIVGLGLYIRRQFFSNEPNYTSSLFDESNTGQILVSTQPDEFHRPLTSNSSEETKPLTINCDGGSENASAFCNNDLRCIRIVKIYCDHLQNHPNDEDTLSGIEKTIIRNYM